MKIIWQESIEGGGAAFSAEENIERALEIEQAIEEETVDASSKPTLKGFGLGQR